MRRLLRFVLRALLVALAGAWLYTALFIDTGEVDAWRRLVVAGWCTGIAIGFGWNIIEEK